MSRAWPPAPTNQGRDPARRHESGSVDHYADSPLDVMDSEVRDAESTSEDSAYVRSYLQASEGRCSGQTLR